MNSQNITNICVSFILGQLLKIFFSTVWERLKNSTSSTTWIVRVKKSKIAVPVFSTNAVDDSGYLPTPPSSRKEPTGGAGCRTDVDWLGWSSGETSGSSDVTTRKSW